VVWVPVGAWIGAVVLGAVVLGFCAYEITWKAHRLQRDLSRLLALQERASALQAEVDVARRRALAAQSEMTG